MESTHSDRTRQLSAGARVIAADGSIPSAGHAHPLVHDGGPNLPGRDEGARPRPLLQRDGSALAADAAGRAPYPDGPSDERAVPHHSDLVGVADDRVPVWGERTAAGPGPWPPSSPTVSPRCAPPGGAGTNSAAPDTPSEGLAGPARPASNVTVSAELADEIRRRREDGDLLADIAHDLLVSGRADLTPVDVSAVCLGRAHVVP